MNRTDIRNSTTTFVQACCAATLLTYADPSTADIAIVVNTNTNVESLTKQQVSNIFLSKINQLPSGELIQPIWQDEDGLLSQAFNETVLERTAGQLQAYWSRIVFSGKGLPPSFVKDTEEMKERLYSDAKMIGYIDDADLDEGLKVVARFH